MIPEDIINKIAELESKYMHLYRLFVGVILAVVIFGLCIVTCNTAQGQTLPNKTLPGKPIKAEYVNSDTSKPIFKLATASTVLAGSSISSVHRYVRMADSTGREVAFRDSTGWHVLDTAATIRVMQIYIDNKYYNTLQKR